MTVGQLREALQGLSPDLEIVLEIYDDGDDERGEDMIQGTCDEAVVEFRCADEAALYISGWR